jgi:methylmalonyl-CoA epimerase
LSIKLDHIGHVVNNFEEAMQLYKKFGLKPNKTMEFAEFGSKMAFFSFAGSELEVIQPGGKGIDPAARCLRERGEGIFHLSLRVDDYEATVKEWKDKGFTVGEYRHETAGHLARIAFLNPDEVKGLWIEFIKEE